jgi:transcriptional regulator with XRE-family HTH domain
MQSGASLLKDWMGRRRLNQAEAAQELGFHESFMSMLVNGHRAPSLDNALLIEEATGIPVKAWSSSRRDNSELVSADGARNRRINKK